MFTVIVINGFPDVFANSDFRSFVIKTLGMFKVGVMTMALRHKSGLIV